jgi:hypothetical protein
LVWVPGQQLSLSLSLLPPPLFSLSCRDGKLGTLSNTIKLSGLPGFRWLPHSFQPRIRQSDGVFKLRAVGDGLVTTVSGPRDRKRKSVGGGG